MPRKKWIDKHSAQTFQLLHRSQTDPGIHDETLPDRILHQISGPSISSSNTTSPTKGLHLADLEEQLDYESVRDNEGEAANYGIYFDDTQYDYMQHLREVGEGMGEAHFVDAAPVTVKGRGKSKGRMMKLEDALREVGLDDSVDRNRGTVSAFGDEEEGSQAPSLVRDRRLEAQQDVPDEIAGFQPDMDPRLREVLEALDDEAYVDEKDEDETFDSLVMGATGAEVDMEEFEATFREDDEDEGWESDRTERPPDGQPPGTNDDLRPVLHPPDQSGLSATLDPSTTPITTPALAAAADEDGTWLAEFAKFKRDAATTVSSSKKPPPQPPSAASHAPSSLYTLNGSPLRQKRRKGALTNPSSYSMTSASLARTDAQRTLDARFDRVAEMYALDDDDEDEDDDVEDGGVSVISGVSKTSRASLSTRSFTDANADGGGGGVVREDLEGMMDGFLEGWERGHPGRSGSNGTTSSAGRGRRKGNNKRGKNGNETLGIAMLDEIRRGLGPARVRT